MDINARIAQFENMAQADPENEMAHYSLGGAYMQAGRFAEGAESYLKCAEVAPQMSKAYQLAGECLVKAGKKDRAAEVLTRGYVIAAERGDLMPRKAIAEMLSQLGRPVPETAGSGSGGAVAGGGVGGGDGGGFIDRKTGRPGTKLDRPPFRGPIGEWIAANITKETWNGWIGQGTKVINEMRLDLSREQDQETYDQQMYEYLGLDDEMVAKLTGRG